MTKIEMYGNVQNQLAIDLNCTVEDLNGEKDSFIFVEARDNPGRRPFLRKEQYFEMLTMGKSIIVTATPARLNYVKEQLAGKSRDEAYAMPFIADYAMNYLPDLDNLKCLSAPDSFSYETIEKSEISKFYDLNGFNNAIQHNPNHPIQNTLLMLAKKNNAIIAIVSAFAWSSKMWSIGIDVLPEYRNNGLATYLVNALTIEILGRNIVPIYATTACNITSQKVAYRAGFMPAWMSDNKLRFEGELSNS
ncbi:MAG: GCN5-related N-acetyltransferase [Anaerocolumna sp.]|nr:GCN5-related N-acetyltransferase [Anaerocolumna sp.]